MTNFVDPTVSDQNRDLAAEQLRLGYATVWPSVMANLGMSAVIFATFTSLGPDAGMFARGFFVAMTLVAALRIWNLHAWRSRPKQDLRITYWMRRHLLTLALNALLWVVFVIALPHYADPGIWMLGIVLVLGNASGVLMNVVVSRVFYIYAMPQLLALMVVAGMYSPLGHGEYIGFLILIYTAYVSAMAHMLGKNLLRGIKDRFENRRLQDTIGEVDAEQRRAAEQIEGEIQLYLNAEERAKRLSEKLYQQYLEAENFEGLLADLALRLSVLPVDGIDPEVDAAMGVTGQAFAFDCVALWETGVDVQNKAGVSLSYIWHSGCFVSPFPDGDIAVQLPLMLTRLATEGAARFPSIGVLRAAAPQEHALLAEANIRSLLLLTLGHSGESQGIIAVATTRRVEAWDDELVRRIRAIGQLLHGAVTRRIVRTSAQRAEQLFEALFKHFLFGIALLTPDGRMRRVNERFRELFRLSRDRDEGALFSDLSLPMGSADRLSVQAAIRAVAHGGEDEAGHEVHLAVDGNEDRIVRITVFGVLAPDSEPQLIGVLAEDISAKRRMRRELNAITREMEHTQRITMLGELAVSMAHELNQPLTAIVNNAEYLKARASGLHGPNVDPNELLNEICDDLIGDAMRAGDIIHRIRAMTRGGSSQFTPIDLNLLISQVLELVHSEIVIRQAVVETRLMPDLPTIEGDTVQLQQVVINLLMNALEAGAKPGNTRSRIEIVTEALGGERVRLLVSDNGPGIPEHRLEHIFEPFQSGKSGGMGMGLMIVRGIVERHGGSISARNGENGGARFRVVFPCRIRAQETHSEISREDS